MSETEKSHASLGICLNVNGPLGKNNTLDVKAYSLEQLPVRMYAVYRVLGHDVCLSFILFLSIILQIKKELLNFCVSILLLPCDPAVFRFTQRSSSCSAEYCRRDLPTSSRVHPPTRRLK